MRNLLLSSFISSALFATCMGSLSAAETRTYTKISSEEAQVVIKTEEQDATQATVYLDGAENTRFINEMMLDKDSVLFKTKQKIEMDNCNKTSTPQNPWIDGCGQAQITAAVATAYGRGGWDAGGATYTFFIGFLSDGSGHYFDVSYVASFSEGVEAKKTANDDYAGSIVKTLKMDGIKEFSTAPNGIKK